MPRATADPARYRDSERRLWESWVGEAPTERWIELPTVRARVRLLEHGAGPTLLFVHGGPNAASKWAPLVARLPDFRCLLLERPGCGLSVLPRDAPVGVRPHVAQIVHDALGAIDAEPDALIASSFGSFCVLAFALAHPDRAPRRIIHMGCPALVPGVKTPLANVLPALPVVGALVRRLQPPSLERTTRAWKEMGHSPAVLRRPEVTEFLEWYTDLTRCTDTRANDNHLFGRVRPRDALSEDELARIEVPMSFLWGEDDSFGDVSVARRIVEALPAATLETVPDGGHLPWLDVPERAASHVRAAVAPAEGGAR